MPSSATRRAPSSRPASSRRPTAGSEPPVGGAPDRPRREVTEPGGQGRRVLPPATVSTRVDAPVDRAVSTATAVDPTERARELLGVSRLTNRALTGWLHGLPGVDQVGCEERAAAPGHPLDQDHEQGVGHRHRHLDDRPHHPRGRRHPRQGARPGRQGPRARPERPDHPAPRRRLRLRRHGRHGQGGPRQQRRQGRGRRHGVPQRPREPAGQARRRRGCRQGRRRRDRHGHRPRRVPRR